MNNEVVAACGLGARNPHLRLQLPPLGAPLMKPSDSSDGVPSRLCTPVMASSPVSSGMLVECQLDLPLAAIRIAGCGCHVHGYSPVSSSSDGAIGGGLARGW